MRCARTFVVGTVCLVVLGLGAGTAAPAHAGSPPKPQKPTLVTGAGDISAAIAKYQALLGADNGGVPQTFPSGRREINWDGVPDEFSEPNSYPPDFFNAPQEPRARGVVLSTPGDHLGVSADSDNPSRCRGPLRRHQPDVHRHVHDVQPGEALLAGGQQRRQHQVLPARHDHARADPRLRGRVHRRRQQGSRGVHLLRPERSQARHVPRAEVEGRAVVPRRRVQEADRRRA